MATSRPRRKRFLRRHPMGLPTVLLVAAVASAGMWWTFHAPDRTGRLAQSGSDATIPRGCLLDDAAGCAAPAFAPLTSNAGDYRTLCRNGPRDQSTSIWAEPGGRLGLRWSLEPVQDAPHPLGVGWAAAWTDPFNVATALFASGPTAGSVELDPARFPAGSQLRYAAGTAAVGGALEDGLDAFTVAPFAIGPTGQPRLAAHINGGQIILEMPPAALEILKSEEQLRFVSSSIGTASCAV